MSKTKDNEKDSISNEPLRVLIDRDARAFANFLTTQSERFSKVQKKIIVLTFGVFAAVAALTLVVSPFTASTIATRRPGNTPSAYRPTLSPRAIFGARPNIQTYSSALHSLDSMYQRDPERLTLIIKERLRMIDSLTTKQ